jgi:hypothetical protein
METQLRTGVVVRDLQTTVRLLQQPGTPQFFVVRVTGPDGGVAAMSECKQLSAGLLVGYRGNGVYNVAVTSYAEAGCMRASGPTQNFSFTQAAKVKLIAPGEPMLLRSAGSSTLKTLAIALVPAGTGAMEVQFANNGAVSPAGGLVAKGSAGSVSSDGQFALVKVRTPGQYAVVARQSVGGVFSTPWSAPAILRVVAPFDLRKVAFTDRVGPVFKVRVQVREPLAAGGLVRVELARGTRSGRFIRVQELKVGRNGAFTAVFRAKSGRHRLRFSYRGNELVALGDQLKTFTVRGGRLKP